MIKFIWKKLPFALALVAMGCQERPEVKESPEVERAELHQPAQAEEEAAPELVPEPWPISPEPAELDEEPVELKPAPEPQTSNNLALGHAAYERGDYELAVKEYTAAIQIDPELAVAYYFRGGSYGRMGRVQEAIDDLTRAIEVDRDYALAYTGRGFLRQIRGELELARRDYLRAIELDSEGEAGRIAKRNLQTLGDR